MSNNGMLPPEKVVDIGQGTKTTYEIKPNDRFIVPTTYEIYRAEDGYFHQVAGPLTREQMEQAWPQLVTAQPLAGVMLFVCEVRRNPIRANFRPAIMRQMQAQSGVDPHLVERNPNLSLDGDSEKADT